MIMSERSKLFDAACDLIDDYERYGEVLQTDVDGKYGDTTPIFKLTKAVNDILGRD